ncbi:hypothetical protein L3X38_010563 [Prunus dulcis]|uniref:Uncharacterized protein n=1 Tax=Prunus dulcis TaxID=3755 RepID=A0AAD4WI02_PRUDU|nr:hypothetical protein L3X38_010563 [Prunus dulcis]
MAPSTNSDAAPLPPLSSPSSPNSDATNSVNSPLSNSNLFLPVLRKFKLLGLINGTEPSSSRTIVSSSSPVVICGIFLKGVFLVSLEPIFINCALVFKVFLKATSMDSYLQSVKEIANGLAIAGQSLSESDLIANGLRYYFEFFSLKFQRRTWSWSVPFQLWFSISFS